MGPIQDFMTLVTQHGSTVLYHRDDSFVPCPCRTPEGFRDPVLHTYAETIGKPITPVIAFQGAGDVNGTVVYRAAYRANFQDKVFDILSDPSNALIAVNNTIQIEFEDFDASEWTEISRIGLFRSVAGINGPFVEISNWVLVNPPINDNIGIAAGPSPIDISQCNEAGMIPISSSVTNLNIKGFVHPVQSGAVRRLTSEQLVQLFGEIESDDHLGIFPCEWGGQIINFYDWGLATEDWIRYNNRDYTVVSTNLIADPLTGNPFHHWEVGLRLVKS